jgi:hypothetical protein
MTGESTVGSGLPEPGRVLGGYVLERVLGRGGMGAVFVGRNASGAVRAIKVPLFDGADSDEHRARFERETRALAKLRPHPNVVRVHGAGTEGPFAYCVLELVEGESLAALVRRGPSPVERALALAEQVARALAHAHEAGVIHRDVKPENVIVRASDGSAVLMDFGLARDREERERLTKTGTVLGTPAYMAPEQVEGASNVDTRADVWATGALLYELLTGERAFDGATHTEILKHVLVDDPRPIATLRSGVPLDVDTVVLRALAKERLQRYPSASELAEDLARARRGEPVLARRAGVGEKLARRVRRMSRAARIAIGATALVVVTGGAAVIVQQARHLAAERSEREARVAGARARLALARTALRGALLAGMAVDRRGVEAALASLGEAKGEVAEDEDEKLARAELRPATAELREALAAATAASPAERSFLSALCDVRDGKATAAREAFSSLAHELDRSDRKDLATLAWMGLARAELDQHHPSAAVEAIARHALSSAPPELAKPLDHLGRRAADEALALSATKTVLDQQRALEELKRSFGRDAWRAVGRGMIRARAAEDGQRARSLAYRLFKDDPGLLADAEIARSLAAWLSADLGTDTIQAVRDWHMLHAADPAASPPDELPFKVKSALLDAQDKTDVPGWIELTRGLVTLGWDVEISAYMKTFLGEGKALDALRSAVDRDKTDWPAALVLALVVRYDSHYTRFAKSGPGAPEATIAAYDEVEALAKRAVDAPDALPVARALAHAVRGEAVLRRTRNQIFDLSHDPSSPDTRDAFDRAVKDLTAACAGGYRKPDWAHDALALGYLCVRRPAEARDAALKAVERAEQRIRIREDRAELVRSGLQPVDLRLSDPAIHARRQLIDAFIALDQIDAAEKVARDELAFGLGRSDAWRTLRMRVLYARGTAADVAEAAGLIDEDLKATLGLSRADLDDDLSSLACTLALYGKSDRVPAVRKKQAELAGR